MNELANSLIDNTVQCLGCPVFDRLFQIVSEAATVIYSKFIILCFILFSVLFAFYVLNAVWQNIKSKTPDPWFNKSVKKVIINSLVALTFLSLGVVLPRFVSTVTFEPVAEIALVYTQSMIQMDTETINQKVTYQPEPMSNTGMFSPELRDTIIMLMKTTITQFQSYMKLGLAIIDKSISWQAFTSIGNLIKHIIYLFIGIYLFYGFFKFFLRFCFYFADIIVAMAFFAFFFPISLIMMSFKGADNVPSWMSKLGSSFGAGQIKTLINAIITLVSAVLTYTVIMVIIAKFFSAPGQSTQDLMQLITSGQIFADDLSMDTVENLTLISCVVLIYVLNFIYSQIPQVTSMILSAFDVKTENSISEGLANDAEKLTTLVVNATKKLGSSIIGKDKEEKKE